MVKKSEKVNTKNKTAYTLGTSNRSQEEFTQILKHYKIKAIIDVRRFPTSRWEHFKKENLQRFLENENIRYFYLGKELGGYRRDGYEDYMQNKSFGKGIERLEKLASQLKSALVCAEKLPWRCHRQFIGKTLQQRGWRIIHIIEKQRVWERKEQKKVGQ